MRSDNKIIPNNYALGDLQENERVHCAIKQGPSNSLNMVIYRNLTQNVQCQTRWFLHWCPAESRSCGSFILLSDFYRMINFGSYSGNYLLVFFLYWGGSVAMCLQSTSELGCVESPVVCCLASKDLHESSGIFCIWLDDEDAWKEAGWQHAAYWLMLTEPAPHSDSCTPKDIVWNSMRNYFLGSIVGIKWVFISIHRQYLPSSFF